MPGCHPAFTPAVSGARSVSGVIGDLERPLVSTMSYDAGEVEALVEDLNAELRHARAELSDVRAEVARLEELAAAAPGEKSVAALAQAAILFQLSAEILGGAAEQVNAVLTSFGVPASRPADPAAVAPTDAWSVVPPEVPVSDEPSLDVTPKDTTASLLARLDERVALIRSSLDG